MLVRERVPAAMAGTASLPSVALPTAYAAVIIETTARPSAAAPCITTSFGTRSAECPR